MLFERSSSSVYLNKKSTVSSCSRLQCHENEQRDPLMEDDETDSPFVPHYDPIQWGWELTGFSKGRKTISASIHESWPSYSCSCLFNTILILIVNNKYHAN